MIIDMPTVSMGNTSGSVLPAEKVSYDNTTSGLEADNVQDAVDEINSNLTHCTLLYDGSSTAGNKTLSQPITNFKWIVVMSIETLPDKPPFCNQAPVYLPYEILTNGNTYRTFITDSYNIVFQYKNDNVIEVTDCYGIDRMQIYGIN